MTKPNPTLRSMTPSEDRLAEMLKALGNPVRFQIVQVLAEKQMCITGEIVEFTTLAQSTVSQHLKVLCEAGLVRGDVEGPATCYCLDTNGVRWLKEQIGNWLPGCCDSLPGELAQGAAEMVPPATPAERGSCC